MNVILRILLVSQDALAFFLRKNRSRLDFRVGNKLSLKNAVVLHCRARCAVLHFSAEPECILGDVGVDLDGDASLDSTITPR